MNDLHNKKVFIDPAYQVYYENRLFDLSDSILNRDDQLLPFYRFREEMTSQGKQVHTADYLLQGKSSEEDNEYYSFGVLDNFELIVAQKLAHLAAFVIMEPPVVLPELYKALPKLTAIFSRVYIHNTHGEGYSLDGVDISKLRKLYWPIPYNDVLQPFWNRKDRLNRVVVINGNHKPRFRKAEHYSTRIEAMADLAKLGVVDLFGRGWDRWWSRGSMWLPYWRNRRVLMSIWRGACTSKFEVLSRYKFCLCFENMAMDGYITEKIFDCLYAGTIPLYLGAPNISTLIPDDVYVDCRKFSSWDAMWKEVKAMPENRIDEMRQAGRAFLCGAQGEKFYRSLEEIIPYLCNGDCKI